MKEISYEDAHEVATNYINCKSKHNTILGIFFVRDGCGACEHMLNEVIPNAEYDDSIFKLFKVDVGDNNVIFPPIRTPMGYFYVEGSPKMPIIREGVGPVDAVSNDMSRMVSVFNGDDFYNVFYDGVPEERIPEHEKKKS